MISPEKKQEVLSRIKELESFIISHGGRDIPIGDLCVAIKAESLELAKSFDSFSANIAHVLGHQLAGVRYEIKIRTIRKRVSKDLYAVRS